MLFYWISSGFCPKLNFGEMGNTMCMTKKDIREAGKNGIGSRSKRMERSKRRSLLEEELLHRQALAMAIQQHQLSQRFDGSMSRRIGSTSSRRRNDLPEQLASSKQVVTYSRSPNLYVLIVNGEPLTIFPFNYSGSFSFNLLYILLRHWIL